MAGLRITCDREFVGLDQGASHRPSRVAFIYSPAPSSSDILKHTAELRNVPYLSSLRLPHHLIHSLGNILHIPRVQPRHADPPVLGHVHMRFLPYLQHLLLRQARKAKHADLLRDVLPAARRAQLLEVVPQCRPHVDDAAAHRPQVRFPLGEQLRVVEHEACDPGAIRGWVADFAALEDGELGANAGDGVLRVRASARYEMKGTGSLAVQAEVLGERLSNAELEALLDEIANCPGVVLEVPGRKTLVGAVEEREMLLGTDDLGELLPLLASGVHAGGVVGAGVQKHDAAFRGLLDCGPHALEVEAFGLRGEVWVGLDGQMDI